MADPLHHSRYSVEHAKRRILELEGEITVFNKTDPCARVLERDPNTAEFVHKIKLVKPLPVALSGIAFDAVTNLRSALDQAGFAVAVAAGKNGRAAHFPFGETLAEVRSRAKGGSKNIPKEIFDVMVSAKPYKGGNILLWALNKLCNTNKHEIIIPMGMAAGGVVMASGTSMKGPLKISVPRWDSAKNEMEYLRTGPTTVADINCLLTFYVAIGKIEIMEGQTAPTVLNAMAGEVEPVLMAIEAEARRIGLFS
jgi:hypothetical protein